jgi:hypothetical protein
MKKVLCMILVGLLAQVASANLLVNGDFEQPVLAPGEEISGGTVPGWTSLLSSPVVANAPGTITGNDSKHLYASQVGFLVQYVGPIQPNTTYTLAVDVGSNTNWYGLASQAGVEIGEFNADGSAAADLAYAGFGTGTIPDPGLGNMTPVTITYTTGDTVTPGHQIAAVLGINRTPDWGYGAVWDNAVFTAVSVPEPASMGLLILGSIAGLLRRRK